MPRVALLCQPHGRGAHWQVRRLPYLVRGLTSANGNEVVVLGPEPMELSETPALTDLTGALSIDGMCSEVGNCDLAVCVDETCYAAVQADTPFVGLFLGSRHLDLVPPDFERFTALYPDLSGAPASIPPSLVAREALRRISGEAAPRAVIRPRPPRRSCADALWSIIVTTHNLTEDHVESTLRCISALREHTGVVHELIVVDRESNVETLSWVKSQGDVRGVFLRGAGSSAQAVHAGAGVAAGEVLFFLHNDQFVEPGWEDAYIAELDAGTGITGTSIWKMGCDGVVRAVGMGEGAFLGFDGTAMRRDVLGAAGGLDSSAMGEYCELADLSWRMQALGFDVGVLDTPRIRHIGYMTRSRGSTGPRPSPQQSMELSCTQTQWSSGLAARWPTVLPVEVGAARDELLFQRRSQVQSTASRAFVGEPAEDREPVCLGVLTESGEPPLVSIVLGTYNQSQYLRAAVDSALGQTYDHLQVIVVDDGSTDDTAEVLSEYDDPRLEVIGFRENRGICAAYNEGFDRVRGHYCSWTSSDNVMHPNQVERLLQALVESPDAGLVYSDFRMIGARHGRAGWGAVRFEDIYRDGKTIGASFMFRSDLLRAGGPAFDERVSGVQDTLMWLDFMMRTRFAYVPDVLYSYRSHDEQLTKRIVRGGGYTPLLQRMREVFDAKYCTWPGQLRVLHVYCHCCHGGVETVVRNLVQALGEHDIASDVCFLQDKGGLSSFEGLCPVHVLGSQRSWQSLGKLSEIISEGRFHAIHEAGAPLVYQAAEEAGFGGPILSTCHGNVDLWLQSIGRRPDFLVAVSGDVVRRAREHGVDDSLSIQVIPNLLPVKRFRSSRPTAVRRAPGGKRVVLWVGRISNEKNWRLFLEIATLLGTQRDDVAFWIVGQADASSAAALQREMAASGLGERITWVADVPYQDMPPLYASARESRGVLVLTSDTEAFGMVLAEAMAARMPVVSRDVGGTPEVVAQGTTGYLIDGTDATRYAAFINLLLDSDELYDEVSEAAMQHSEEHFDSAAVAEHYVKLIREGVQASERPGAIVLSGSRWGTSGGGQRPRKLAEALARSGWHVTFVEQFPDAAGPGAVPGRCEVTAAGALLPGVERTRTSYDLREEMALTDALRRHLGLVRPMMAVNCDYTAMSLLHMRGLKRLGAVVAYDCIDNWQAFAEAQTDQGDAAGYRAEVEVEICRTADVITASAYTLAEVLADRLRLATHPTVIANSLDPEMLERDCVQVPADLPRGDLVVGYVGSIWGSWLDWDIVLHVARERPDWQIWLVGGDAALCSYRGGAACELRRLHNVHFIAEVPHETVHAYIDAFDVAIIPFVLDEITNCVHPLKVYDYLARAKPVVSTRLPEIEGFPGVHTSDDASLWPEIIEQAAGEGVDHRAVRAFLADRTWARAVDGLVAACGLSHPPQGELEQEPGDEGKAGEP